MKRLLDELGYDPVVWCGDVFVDPLTQLPFPTPLNPEMAQLASCPGLEVLLADIAFK